jgi:hypothetical protein
VSRRRIADADIIDALMVSRTDTEAADRLGIARETISRRRAQPGFAAKLEGARQERHVRITDRVDSVMDAAVIRVAHVLAEDGLNHGLTAYQLVNARRQAGQVLMSFYLGLRSAGRDDQLRQLEQEMTSARLELAELRALVGKGVSSNGHRDGAAV